MGSLEVWQSLVRPAKPTENAPQIVMGLRQTRIDLQEFLVMDNCLGRLACPQIESGESEMVIRSRSRSGELGLKSLKGFSVTFLSHQENVQTEMQARILRFQCQSLSQVGLSIGVSVLTDLNSGKPKLDLNEPDQSPSVGLAERCIGRLQRTFACNR